MSNPINKKLNFNINQGKLTFDLKWKDNKTIKLNLMHDFSEKYPIISKKSYNLDSFENSKINDCEDSKLIQKIVESKIFKNYDEYYKFYICYDPSDKIEIIKINYYKHIIGFLNTNIIDFTLKIDYDFNDQPNKKDDKINIITHYKYFNIIINPDKPKKNKIININECLLNITNKIFFMENKTFKLDIYSNLFKSQGISIITNNEKLTRLSEKLENKTSLKGKLSIQFNNYFKKYKTLLVNLISQEENCNISISKFGENKISLGSYYLKDKIIIFKTYKDGVFQDIIYYKKQNKYTGIIALSTVLILISIIFTIIYFLLNKNKLNKWDSNEIEQNLNLDTT